MNTDAVEKIANAVLYEGYLLYPYRSSAVKNRQRFNFGVLYPRGYGEASEMKTECLATGGDAATLEVRIRFLQMSEQDGRQEGVERSICLPALSLRELRREPLRREFAFHGRLRCEVELSAADSKLTLIVRNPLEAPAEMSRDEALLLSLVSVHSILRIAGGEFVSLLEPPEQFARAAAACENIGTWPVLAGEPGQRDTMLSSPIILYDYPEIAPESAGDMFDGAEIDEILALRILTLTDDEKLEVKNGDDRARRILERTEMLPPEHFRKLHGALRGMR